MSSYSNGTLEDEYWRRVDAVHPTEDGGSSCTDVSYNNTDEQSVPRRVDYGIRT